VTVSPRRTGYLADLGTPPNSSGSNPNLLETKCRPQRATERVSRRTSTQNVPFQAVRKGTDAETCSYIEAIESRLHRMEVLLGGLLGSDDPRAQTLLGELIGAFFTRKHSSNKLTENTRQATRKRATFSRAT
jgi:hypothetical protein